MKLPFLPKNKKRKNVKEKNVYYKILDYFLTENYISYIIILTKITKNVTYVASKFYLGK